LNKLFATLSFKQKNKYLAIGAGVFAVIVYSFAVSHTITEYRQVKELERKVQKAKQSPGQMAALENKLAFINSKVNAYLIDSTRNQESILDAVSTFCQKNNLILREFPKTGFEEQKDITIETKVILAEGTYVNLLRLVYELEHKNKVGKLTSVNFNSFMDTKRKKLVLTATIYLQNIRIKNKADEKS
jgi:hypothetical protein